MWVRPDRNDLHARAEMADAGTLRVPIDQTFAWADAAEAHRASKTGHTRGKIIVRI